MHRRLATAITVCLSCATGWVAFPGAQSSKADWLTDGFDARRTAWQQNETILTTADVKDMKLLWKVNLESTPRAMHNLFAPLVAERVTTAQGPRELAVVAGVSDDLYGIDVAAGRQIWHRRFDSTLAKPGGTNDTLCPGGQTAAGGLPGLPDPL